MESQLVLLFYESVGPSAYVEKLKVTRRLDVMVVTRLSYIASIAVSLMG